MAETKASTGMADTEIGKITSIRPSFLEIDLAAFDHNFGLVKAAAGPAAKIMAIVKANAYGHGLVPIAQRAQERGADFLGVALIEEGERLSAAGIKIPIVVLYPDAVERARRLVQAGLVATVSSIEHMQGLNAAAISGNAPVQVFLKVETGMGRYGASMPEMRQILAASRQMKAISILGISTNLADSSNGDDAFTRQQFDQFMKAVSELDPWRRVSYYSIENSSGLLYHHRDSFNLVRVGLALYGICPRKDPLDSLKPALSLKSRIIQIKKWPAKKPVGYGGTFVPKRDSVLATIGLGYGDGYPWSLSNKAQVLINGQRAPIAGRVCMDAIIIDVTDVAGVKTGDEVVLVGRSGNDEISILELAELAGSFAYELLSGFSDRLPRIYRE